ncbi:MAG: hypothetical protein KA206_07325 [Paludibacter sp.]|nr:hypothetical protein [Paludibacter sp.]
MLTTKKNRNTTPRESTAMLLLLLFVGFFVSISFFKHKHIVNGVLIVHSHPFSSSENHSHGADGTNIIQLLSHFNAKSATLATLALKASFLLRIITTASSSINLNSAYNFRNFTRPPPTSLTH